MVVWIRMAPTGHISECLVIREGYYSRRVRRCGLVGKTMALLEEVYL